MPKKLSKILWHGTKVDGAGKPVLPSVATDDKGLNGLLPGELFMHVGKEKVSLWALSLSGEVVEVSGKVGEADVDLSDYLLKSVWDSVFEIKTDVSGQKYILGKLPVVTSRGLTTYASNDVELPTIAEELPYDKKTIWLNPETGKIEVIGGTGGSGGEGGMTTIEPLTINDNTGTAVVVYDGSEKKSITLSKNLVGLDKVDNIPDSDKYVGYARGLKNSKGTVYVSYGLIGSDPYNVLGRGGEETWIQGKEVYFYIGGYSHATSRLSLRSDGSVRVGNSLCVGKSVTPNATLDVEGDAIISGNLKAGSFNVGVFKIEYGIEIGNVSLSEDEEGNLDVSTNVEVDGDVSAVNANVTESVNIGGIKLTKLEDGVLKLDGHLVVTGGLTTYANDETSVPNEILQSLMERVSALESEVERLKNG